jgi:hypothetical protein
MSEGIGPEKLLADRSSPVMLAQFTRPWGKLAFKTQVTETQSENPILIRVPAFHARKFVYKTKGSAVSRLSRRRRSWRSSHLGWVIPTSSLATWPPPRGPRSCLRWRLSPRLSRQRRCWRCSRLLRWVSPTSTVATRRPHRARPLDASFDLWMRCGSSGNRL